MSDEKVTTPEVVQEENQQKTVPLHALHEAREKLKAEKQARKDLEDRIASIEAKEAEAREAKMKENEEYSTLLEEKEAELVKLRGEVDTLSNNFGSYKEFIRGQYDNEIGGLEDDKKEAVKDLLTDINPETDPLGALRKIRAVNKIIGSTTPTNMNVRPKGGGQDQKLDKIADLQAKINEEKNPRDRLKLMRDLAREKTKQ